MAGSLYPFKEWQGKNKVPIDPSILSNRNEGVKISSNMDTSLIDRIRDRIKFGIMYVQPNVKGPNQTDKRKITGDDQLNFEETTERPTTTSSSTMATKSESVGEISRVTNEPSTITFNESWAIETSSEIFKPSTMTLKREEELSTKVEASMEMLTFRGNIEERTGNINGKNKAVLSETTSQLMKNERGTNLEPDRDSSHEVSKKDKVERETTVNINDLTVVVSETTTQRIEKATEKNLGTNLEPDAASTILGSNEDTTEWRTTLNFNDATFTKKTSTLLMKNTMGTSIGTSREPHDLSITTQKRVPIDEGSFLLYPTYSLG